MKMRLVLILTFVASIPQEQADAAADQGEEGADRELTDEQRAKATMAQWVKTDEPPPATGGSNAGEPAAADRNAEEASGEMNREHWEDGDEEDGEEEETVESVEGEPAEEVTEAGLDGRDGDEEVGASRCSQHHAAGSAPGQQSAWMEQETCEGMDDLATSMQLMSWHCHILMAGEPV